MLLWRSGLLVLSRLHGLRLLDDLVDLVISHLFRMVP